MKFFFFFFFFETSCLVKQELFKLSEHLPMVTISWHLTFFLCYKQRTEEKEKSKIKTATFVVETSRVCQLVLLYIS